MSKASFIDTARKELWIKVRILCIGYMHHFSYCVWILATWLQWIRKNILCNFILESKGGFLYIVVARISMRDFFYRNRVIWSLGWVWITLKIKVFYVWHFFYGSCALFTIPANAKNTKMSNKSGSHGYYLSIKNYFVTVFSVISFQFWVINSI